jgi:hypothetical protein
MGPIVKKRSSYSFSGHEGANKKADPFQNKIVTGMGRLEEYININRF